MTSTTLAPKTTTIPDSVERALQDIQAAERVSQAARTWRSTVMKELGVDHPLHSIAEQAVTKSASEVMRRQIAFYDAVEPTDITYDEAMVLLYGEDYEPEQI